MTWFRTVFRVMRKSGLPLFASLGIAWHYWRNPYHDWRYVSGLTVGLGYPSLGVLVTCEEDDCDKVWAL